MTRNQPPTTSHQPLATNHQPPATSHQPALPYQIPFEKGLIALLVTALMMGPIAVIESIASLEGSGLLPLICFLVALEGSYTATWLRHPERRILNRPRYRVAEFVVIALVLRLFTWLFTGVEWRSYLLNPLSIFDPVYLIYVVLALVSWERSNTLSNAFRNLSLDEAEQAYYSLPHEQRQARFGDRPVALRRTLAFPGLVQQWLIGGFLLTVCTTIATVRIPTEDLSLRTIRHLGLSPLLLLGLIVYFVLGLWLISQARLRRLETRWIIDKIETRPGIFRTWQRTSLLLIVTLAIVSAFLPIGSTFGIARIITAIINVAFFIIGIILFVISMISFLFFSLFGSSEATEEPPELNTQPVIEPPAESAPPPAEMSESTALILGSAFWIVMLVLIVMAVVFFLRGRGYQLNRTLFRQLWTDFVVWWRSAWKGVSGRVTQLSQSITLRRPTDQTPANQPPWRFMRVNALSPRDQIRYFYLSTVRRAEEKGVPRQESETPTEFADDLKASWPEAVEEIDELTQAFQKARYSPQTIEKEELNPIKRTWKQVRSSLKRRRK